MWKHGNNTIEYGYIQFNTTFVNTFGDVTVGDTGDYDFEYVAIHEIGHLLKLKHTATSGCTMQNTVNAGVDFNGLCSHDVYEIQRKY